MYDCSQDGGGWCKSCVKLCLKSRTRSANRAERETQYFASGAAFLFLRNQVKLPGFHSPFFVLYIIAHIHAPSSRDAVLLFIIAFGVFSLRPASTKPLEPDMLSAREQGLILLFLLFFPFFHGMALPLSRDILSLSEASHISPFLLICKPILVLEKE